MEIRKAIAIAAVIIIGAIMAIAYGYQKIQKKNSQ